MPVVGHVEALFRCPIKSMATEALDEAQVGWHGIDGDRRFALRRIEDASGMPWLTGSKLPDLVRCVPIRRDDGPGLPTHVRLPDGQELAVRSAELAAELGRMFGKPVEMMRLDRGIFDETPISVIAASTIGAIGEACGRELDVRYFRPNVVVRTTEPRGFEDDAWVGAVLSFGDDGPEVAVQQRDERCAMLNLDPVTAKPDPQILKSVVRLNGNHAGVYATVIRRGRLAIGQPVHLHYRA